jgi:hypothetical protein
LRALILALTPVLLAASAGAPPSPAPTISPSPAPPSASPQPVATPVAQPPPGTATPVPVPPATPVPTVQPPAFRYVFTPPPGSTPAPAGAPQIIEVDCTDQVIHQNQDVAMRVVTTSAVSAVTLSALGRSAPLPQVAPGVWAASSHVPSVPFFFLNRTYTVQIVAATSDGRSDTVSFPVRLER